MKPKFLMLTVAVIAVASFSLFGQEQQKADATIHELVASFCAASGGGEQNPPGLSDPTKKNFAKPLLATGVVQLIPIVGPDGPGLLVDIDGDHPASKFDDGGEIVKVGEFPDGTIIYFHTELIPTHPAFEHCANLSVEE